MSSLYDIDDHNDPMRINRDHHTERASAPGSCGYSKFAEKVKRLIAKKMEDTRLGEDGVVYESEAENPDNYKYSSRLIWEAPVEKEDPDFYSEKTQQPTKNACGIPDSMKTKYYTLSCIITCLLSIIALRFIVYALILAYRMEK